MSADEQWDQPKPKVEPEKDVLPKNDMTVLARSIDGLIKEHKANRFWSRWLKILIIGYLLYVIVMGIVEAFQQDELVVLDDDYVAVIHLDGMIADGLDASAEVMIPLLDEAMADDQAVGVMIKANSPGGSPTQSELIFEHLLALREQHPEKKVITMVGDVCASGCYYIAAGSDQIYSAKNSMIGSIGVRLDAFDAVEMLEKLGVKSRTLSAGEHKTLLDPFNPEDEKARLHLQMAIVDQTHQHFVTAVKRGRGERLTTRTDVFNGLIWLGEDAQSLGLIDGVDSVKQVALKVFETDNLQVYAPQMTPLEALRKELNVMLPIMRDVLIQTANRIRIE